MEMLNVPNENKLRAIMRQNQIEFAALFGSHAKGTAKKDSDYDVLIEFSPNARVGLFKFQTIQDELSSVLGERVDLVTVGGIDRHIKDEVLSTMKVIYGIRPKR